jgi:hypothetical protein
VFSRNVIKNSSGKYDASVITKEKLCTCLFSVLSVSSFGTTVDEIEVKKIFPKIKCIQENSEISSVWRESG